MPAIKVLNMFQNRGSDFLNQACAGHGAGTPGFLVLLLSANFSMCVCPPPRLLITSGVMWCDVDPIRLVE